MNQARDTQGQPQQKRHLSTIFALLTLVASSAIFIDRPSRATTPEQTSINEILGNSSELLIRRSGRRESVQTGSVLQRFRDALITAPPNNARALLRFLDLDGTDLNMYVLTHPHPESAIYYFPCQIQGGNTHIGWGLARDASRGCETGMNVRRGRSNTSRASGADLSAASKQLAQTPLRQIFYCNAASAEGQTGFATATSSNPCSEAIQQCQSQIQSNTPGGSDCQISTTGFWWTNEEQLHATLDCTALPESTDLVGGDAALPLETLPSEAMASTQIEGNGATFASDLEASLQALPGQSCTVQVYRPEDFIIIPAPDEVVLGLGDDETLVQVRDTETGLQVDVIKGAINVRSVNDPNLRVISKGERYIHSASSSEVTSFSRSEALTSIDMEVLCAFSGNATNNLNVSACREANLLPASGQSELAFCNREQGAGGQEGDLRTLQMGSNRGEIEIDYEMFAVPDRVQLIYEGREILDTGFISGDGRLS
ncbi:MAG: hypothetical protein WBA57_09765, partial [Elainellaceae cyanobacterium]